MAKSKPSPILGRKKSPKNHNSIKEIQQLPWLNESIGKFVMPSEKYRISTSEEVMRKFHKDGTFTDIVRGACVIGPGLKRQKLLEYHIAQEFEEILVCKPGILTRRKPNTYFVEVSLRNYTPAVKEDVIGIITKKAGESYVVDIGTRDRVTLPKLAFAGATKKNKPDLKIGDIVFGRIKDLPPDFPFELTCDEPDIKKAHGHGLGPLENGNGKGYVFRVPVYMIQKLRSNQKHKSNEENENINLLKELGKFKDAPFEIAIGDNGFIWVKSRSMAVNVLIAQVIQTAVDLPFTQYKSLVKQFQQSFELLRSA